MKQLICIVFLGLGLFSTACNNNTQTDHEIDSINQAKADSLLEDALTDSMSQDNTLTVDTIGE